MDVDRTHLLYSFGLHCLSGDYESTTLEGDVLNPETYMKKEPIYQPYHDFFMTLFREHKLLSEPYMRCRVPGGHVVHRRCSIYSSRVKDMVSLILQLDEETLDVVYGTCIAHARMNGYTGRLNTVVQLLRKGMGKSM